ncbi:UNVERIFIED_CONTAM: L-gulonolactone oxidase 3 [Sesamum angustifolium]|uniref:L-gulonolactone oxidase 3 n=1 Tax=Sesamum angustifolium TaxID=2727405 RepID=A0AAW2ILW0_9LAMI
MGFSSPHTRHATTKSGPVQPNRLQALQLLRRLGRPERLPVQAVVYPTTEEELRSAVANANKNHLKVKVVSRFSHTIPKLACPTNQSRAILISTEKYNTSIDVDVASMTVTADAGVGLRAVIDRVEAEGLSLVAAPYWEGVSVGG